MTHEEARQIDKEEFQAECAAIRQRAFAYVERRRHELRASIAHWLGREVPSLRFVPAYTPAKPEKAPKRRIGEKHTIHGEARTMREWAEHLGISYIALCGRAHRMGSLEAAVAAGGPMPKGPRPKAGNDNTPGVVSNFHSIEGTGAGRLLQESTEITFSEKAVIE